MCWKDLRRKNSERYILKFWVCVMQVKVLYGSQKGTCHRLAEKLCRMVEATGGQAVLVNMKDYEVENLFKERSVVIVISTYENGSPPKDAAWFCRCEEWLCAILLRKYSCLQVMLIAEAQILAAGGCLRHQQIFELGQKHCTPLVLQYLEQETVCMAIISMSLLRKSRNALGLLVLIQCVRLVSATRTQAI